MYTECMKNISVDDDGGSWLRVTSICYCFLSLGNIGFSRIGDNRWVTQHEALFCVLNGRGEVLTWRLTPGLSFSEVEQDLVALKERLVSQGVTLKEFYIDNCCSWRKKLQSVFGDDLIVYLDIFHAACKAI